MANKRRLFLDLDGVMVDFDSHFPNKFNKNHKEMSDDVMWDHIVGTDFFLTAPPCEHAIDHFNMWKEQFDVKILTACPKRDYENAAKQKKQWVKTHLGSDVFVIAMLHGKYKYLFMQDENDILVDDYKKNIGPWVDNGGIGIIHRSMERTNQILQAYRV